MCTAKQDIIGIALLFCMLIPSSAQDRPDGFYKDLFMDSGIMLTSRTDLPSARLAGFSMECFISTPHSYTEKYSFTATDSILQEQLIGGSAIDENGILLYPDGAPRFRAVYVNGGRAGSHGKSLGDKGRNSYRTFVANGGGYVGSCAGAFIASVGTKLPDKEEKLYTSYLGIWPGYATSTGLEKSSTKVDIEPGSPLLNYYQFGGKMTIDSVRHNGGCYANLTYKCPERTEVLARYSTPADKPKRNIVGEPVVWAYKGSPTSGRVVLCGSHPENICEGPRLELTAAMLKYAMDGYSLPQIKGVLEPGIPRIMKCYTHDNTPEFTRIGDKQYHHFAVDIPEKTDTLTIELSPLLGYKDFDLYLFANPQQLAFKDKSMFSNITLGSHKQLVILNPKAGRLYISVFCDTTVDVIQTRYGTQYAGRTDVLNGVPYEINVRLSRHTQKR